MISPHDAAIDRAITAQLGTYPAEGDGEYSLSLLAFTHWADSRNVNFCPARPATIAQFILERAALGLDALSEIVAEIAELHQRAQLANPVATWAVSEALSRIGKIDRPKSWAKKFEARFVQLPPDLREYILKNEERRDLAARKAMNEANNAKQKLAALEKQATEVDR